MAAIHNIHQIYDQIKCNNNERRWTLIWPNRQGRKKHCVTFITA